MHIQQTTKPKTPAKKNNKHTTGDNETKITTKYSFQVTVIVLKSGLPNASPCRGKISGEHVDQIIQLRALTSSTNFRAS